MLISSQLTGHETQIVNSAANHPCLRTTTADGAGFPPTNHQLAIVCYGCPFRGIGPLIPVVHRSSLGNANAAGVCGGNGVGTNAREDARQIPALIARVIISFVRAGLVFVWKTVPALILMRRFHW